jgi:hypothetical protein
VALRDIRYRKQFIPGYRGLNQMRKRSPSRVAPEPLEILIRIEADDMDFDSAIGVAQSPLQQSTKLAQQGEYGILVGLNAGNPVRRTRTIKTNVRRAPSEEWLLS